MDSDSPAARVERTFWAVWNYITGAVNRFLRPETIDISNDNTNSTQEFPVSGPTNRGPAEGDAEGIVVAEETSPATASLLNPSRPLVSWELCSGDITSGPDEESTRYETQASRGSDDEPSEDDVEGGREEQSVQAGLDDAGLLVADRKLSARRQDETPEDGVCEEQAKTASDPTSEDMDDTGRKAAAQEETEGSETPQDPRNLSGTLTAEDETDSQDGNTELKCRLKTYLSLEEEDKVHIEEVKVQRNEEDTAEGETTEGEPQLKPEEENQLSVSEDSSDDNRDFKGDPSFTSQHVEPQTTNKSVTVSKDEPVFMEPVMARGSESDEVEDAEMEEGESTLDEDAAIKEEIMNEATNKETAGDAPEWKDDIITVTEDIKVLLYSETELHAAELADREEDDVDGDTEEQNKASEQDDDETESCGTMSEEKSDVTTYISVDERIVDIAQVEEERLISDAGNVENNFINEEKPPATASLLSPSQPLVSWELCSRDINSGPDGESMRYETQTSRGSDVKASDEEEETREEQSVQAGLDDAGLLDRDTEEQNKASEQDDDETESRCTMSDEKSDVTTYISMDKSIVDQMEEQRLFGDVGNIENDLTTTGIGTSVTVKPEGETGWEMSKEFNNNPPGISEGRVVVLQELNFPTCEEMQEGVPEYNNEPGPDENTTQRFLEEGDCKELQGSQLPEEAERKEPESLENSGFSTRADYLLAREHMEKEQESTRDIKENLDAGLPRKIEEQLVETVSQESEHLFEEAEEKLLVESMKTGIGHSEKHLDSDVGLTEETDEAEKELHEEILIEYDMDKVLCDAAGGSGETTGAVTAEEVVAFADEEFLDIEGQEMTGSSFFQYVGATFDDVNPIFRESITGAEILECYDQTNALKELLADDEMQNTEILTPFGAGTAELESSQSEESLETESQPSDEARGMSHQELFGGTEAADDLTTLESKPKDLTLISTDKVEKDVTESEGSSHNVIEEEILDLWLQTALSEDTDHMKQQEPRQRVEPSDEEQEEISSVQTEMDKEQRVELKPKESELLLSDIDMSSSTVESGFWDQSLSEQSSKTQLLKLPCTESLMTDSADSESQDVVMEETADAGRSYLKEEESMTETGFLPDSGVPLPDISGYLNQDSETSQENTEEEKVESVEPETGTQKQLDAEGADWKDIEEEDDKSEMEISSLFKVEKAKAEDDPLVTTVCDFPEEIKHTESGRSGGNSETLLEDEIVLTEPGSHGDADAESEKKSPSVDRPQPGWSEDVSESLPGLNGADVADKLMTESVDQIDNSALDFTAQRSRIAVKNPRVRPPKDPRSLLHMPSVEPTPSPQRSAKVPAGVPLGGLGIGIKLPGLGAGFPVLKKTQRVVRDENSSDTLSQEVKPQEKSDSPKQDEAPHKPKWMPPRHPGFGNPLMSELKTKLKKTTKE